MKLGAIFNQFYRLKNIEASKGLLSKNGLRQWVGINLKIG